jgi:hypothetical protein
MRRYLLLVLLATGLAAADKKPKTEHAAQTKAKTDAVQGQTQEAQAKTKAAQEQTAEAQAGAEQAKEPTEEPQAQTDKNGKLTSVPDAKALGMSILGNQEAPTSLVIVPWKSSEVGRSMGISPMLDDSRQPVDKEVFMRELRYYEIRSEPKK